MRPGEETLVTVFLETVLGLPAGKKKRSTRATFAGSAVVRLRRSRAAGACGAPEGRRGSGGTADQPGGGGVAWLYGALPDEARAYGRRSAGAGGGRRHEVLTVLGRHRRRPAMDGRRGEFVAGAERRRPRLVLPAGTSAARIRRDLAILLEAVEAGATPRLDRLIFAPVGEPAKQITGEG